MNRLKKELKNKGIISTGYDGNVETVKTLAFYTNNFIIVLFSSNVINSFFEIYDTNFNLIGTQNRYFDYTGCFNFGGFSGWNSYGHIETSLK